MGCGMPKARKTIEFLFLFTSPFIFSFTSCAFFFLLWSVGYEKKGGGWVWDLDITRHDFCIHYTMHFLLEVILLWWISHVVAVVFSSWYRILYRGYGGFLFCYYDNGLDTLNLLQFFALCFPRRSVSQIRVLSELETHLTAVDAIGCLISASLRPAMCLETR